VAESRSDVQVRVLFEQRTVELFHSIKHLADGCSLTLLCFDGKSVAWKTDSSQVYRLFMSSLGGYRERGSFVTVPSDVPLDCKTVFEALPPHAEVQWAVFFGRGPRCCGYVSNCDRSDIAREMPIFLHRAIAYSAPNEGADA
jgi:hypothetical protein